METLSTTPPESSIQLVVEELMPGENYSRVHRRVARFLKAGVKEVWLLEATARAVCIYNSSGIPTVVDEDVEEAGEVDPGLFPCTIEQFFGPPGASS